MGRSISDGPPRKARASAPPTASVARSQARTHRLPMDEMEYTTMPELMETHKGQWEAVR